MSDAMLTGSEEIFCCNTPVGSLLSPILPPWHLIVMLPIYRLIGRTLYNIPIGAKYLQSEMIMLYKFMES